MLAHLFSVNKVKVFGRDGDLESRRNGKVAHRGRQRETKGGEDLSHGDEHQ